MKIKDTIIYVATILISALFIIAGNAMFSDYNVQPHGNMRFRGNIQFQGNIESHRAIVLSIYDIVEVPILNYFASFELRSIKFTAEIINGEQSGRIIYGVQDINTLLMQYREIDKGDRILVMNIDNIIHNGAEWVFIDYDRTNILLLLCIAFFVLIMIIAGKKGIDTIVSLILLFFTIFLVYVPSILSGFNVYLSTMIVSTFIIVMNLLLINGANKKTLSAILGNLGGIIVAGLLAYFMNNILHFTGLADEHYIQLSLVKPDNPLNLIAIAWGGMMLGSLGAIMDVSMTIASSMHELAVHMKERTFIKMIGSGMNIGRDIIGTMANTLILAYIGGSLALVLLLMVNITDTVYLFSMEMISVQIVKSIIGSMGILFAVPFTAVVSAYMYNSSNTRTQKRRR